MKASICWANAWSSWHPINVSYSLFPLATSEHADQSSVRNLGNAGCEVLFIPEQELSDSLRFVLNELGKRRCTNILLEGGGTLLGNAFDGNLIDQIHCFIAPKLIGGLGAVRPIAGVGKSLMSQAGQLHKMTVKSLGDNVHISSFLSRRR